MAKKARAEPTKQRTRKHVIACQSVNHVEKFVYDKGYSAERVESDYGYDLIVFTYDKNGYVEPGFVLLQLKATDSIRIIDNGTQVSFTISIKDYRLWMAEGYPVFLIVYDAVTRGAYWLYFQKHFEDDATREPKTKATTVTVRVPLGNVLSEATIDYMREKKQPHGKVCQGAAPMTKNLTFGELAKALREFGYDNRLKGSHIVFQHPQGRQLIVFPIMHDNSEVSAMHQKIVEITVRDDGIVDWNDFEYFLNHGKRKEDLIRKGDHLIWLVPNTGRETRVVAAATEQDGVVIIKQGGTFSPCPVSQLRKASLIIP